MSAGTRNFRPWRTVDCGSRRHRCIDRAVARADGQASEFAFDIEPSTSALRIDLRIRQKHRKNKAFLAFSPDFSTMTNAVRNAEISVDENVAVTSHRQIARKTHGRIGAELDAGIAVRELNDLRMIAAEPLVPRCYPRRAR